MEYAEFLENKRLSVADSGFEAGDLPSGMFRFQSALVRWACRKGKAALFCDTGLGKTLMQLAWADQVRKQKARSRILILCPLAVAPQTQREATKFGIDDVCISAGESRYGFIHLANYEKLHRFKPGAFDAIVLDEASILKGLDSKTRILVTDSFRDTPYKLEATATPAPNDHMELGNHAEFIGVMSRSEMLSMFFVHDGGETQKWRLKGHAQSEFWRWMCEWAAMVRRPSDLAFEDGGFALPPLRLHEHVVENAMPAQGQLFATEARTLSERRQARKHSISERADLCAQLINGGSDHWVVWCNLNDEGTELARRIPDAVEVAGRHSLEEKEARLDAFTRGDVRVMVTKPTIGGFGLNWQHCHNVAFVGLSDSWEQYYQAVRRCWRFGQTQPVDCHLIVSELEGQVLANIKRKESDAVRMYEGMVEHMRDIMQANICGTQRMSADYNADEKMEIPAWLRSSTNVERANGRSTKATALS